MLALYRSGRQAEALQVFQVIRRTLVNELGIEPTQELRRLERQILNHDLDLAAPDAYWHLGTAQATLPLQPTSRVGREHEIRKVTDPLRQPEVRLTSAGNCMGSMTPPLDGTTELGRSNTPTGLCAVCAGRIQIRDDGLLPHHRPVPDDQRALQQPANG